MIIRLIQNILSRQNPEEAHTLVTRVVVSAIIVFVNLVLYGFYGVIAAVFVYLVVEWGRWPPEWVFAPLVVGFLIALRKASHAVRDYWENYGH